MRARDRTGLACTLLALGACATVSPSEAAGPAEIMIAAGPCFGACPTYSARVDASGAGHFTGTRFTRVTGNRDFAIDPAAFRRIAAALAPYRPARDRAIGPEECARFHTDAPSWTVRWTDRSGARVSLHLNLGCTDARYQPMADAIRSVGTMLGIDPLVAHE